MVVSTKVWEEKVVTVPQIFVPSNFKHSNISLKEAMYFVWNWKAQILLVSSLLSKWGSIRENPIMGLFALLLIKDLLVIKLAYFSMSWNG